MKIDKCYVVIYNEYIPYDKNDTTIICVGTNIKNLKKYVENIANQNLFKNIKWNPFNELITTKNGIDYSYIIKENILYLN